jgi:hypothetical protein
MTAAGGGALKSIPDEVGAAAGAGIGGGGGEGEGIHEGTKGFAPARGTKEPAFGFNESPASFVVGGVAVVLLLILSSWLLIVVMSSLFVCE